MEMDNKANMEIESNMKNWNEVSPKKKKNEMKIFKRNLKLKGQKYTLI